MKNSILLVIFGLVIIRCTEHKNERLPSNELEFVSESFYKNLSNNSKYNEFNHLGFKNRNILCLKTMFSDSSKKVDSVFHQLSIEPLGDLLVKKYAIPGCREEVSSNSFMLINSPKSSYFILQANFFDHIHFTFPENYILKKEPLLKTNHKYSDTSSRRIPIKVGVYRKDSIHKWKLEHLNIPSSKSLNQFLSKEKLSLEELKKLFISVLNFNTTKESIIACPTNKWKIGCPLYELSKLPEDYNLEEKYDHIFVYKKEQGDLFSPAYGYYIIFFVKKKTSGHFEIELKALIPRYVPFKRDFE